MCDGHDVRANSIFVRLPRPPPHTRAYAYLLFFILATGKDNVLCDGVGRHKLLAGVANMNLYRVIDHTPRQLLNLLGPRRGKKSV